VSGETLPSMLEHLPRLVRELEVRTVYTDLDGTLLGPGGSLIGHPSGPTAEPAAALAALAEAGVDSIDILKLDTEGCEVPILRSLASRLPRTGIIYVEFHSERDRMEIDRLVLPTHALFQGRIMKPYRGELCYVIRAILPDPNMNISVY
jgi:hypothetical protein